MQGNWLVLGMGHYAFLGHACYWCFLGYIPLLPQANGRFYFASEIKAIIEDETVKRELNELIEQLKKQRVDAENKTR